MKARYRVQLVKLTIPKQTSTTWASPPSSVDQAREASSSLRRLSGLSVSALPMLAITQGRTSRRVFLQFISAMAVKAEILLRVKLLGRDLKRVSRLGLAAPTALRPINMVRTRLGASRSAYLAYLDALASAKVSLSFFMLMYAFFDYRSHGSIVAGANGDVRGCFRTFSGSYPASRHVSGQQNISYSTLFRA